ncbi:MAG TPA: hypothetical protein DD979_02155 [Gammaproteobacteria bacterium]|jgi:hypothetical protein|nr:hypothetical protein [Gammaproteobacteria bacterium]
MFEFMGTLALSLSCSSTPALSVAQNDPLTVLEDMGVSVVLDPDQLHIEEVWQSGDFCFFTVIGNDWHTFGYAIVKQAKNVEFYGSLMADYGTEVYFARDADTMRFVAVFDPENDDDAHHPYDKWRQRVPPEIVDDLENEY